MLEETTDALQRYLEDGEFRVPPLPEVATRVTALASQPDVSAAAIVDLVHRDAGLSSELLRYANSASAGARQEIVSVHQATVHLGIERVSQVALAASLRSEVFALGVYASLAKMNWSRSIETAVVSKAIARLQAQNVEVSFLCGLLWQIGSMLALRAIGELSTRKELPGKDIPDEEEASVLATDLNDRFREAAVEAWNLPPIVTRALSGSPSGSPKPLEAQIAFLAYDIAPHLLADGPQDIAAYTARPAAESLNIYPEHFEQLVSQADELRVEIEAMP